MTLARELKKVNEWGGYVDSEKRISARGRSKRQRSDLLACLEGLKSSRAANVPSYWEQRKYV